MRKPFVKWFSMRCVALALVLPLAALAATAGADDKPAAGKTSPEGTWKWTFERNDQKVEMSVKLKWADGKLTGVYVGRDGTETPIKDGGFKDGVVSFAITRERNGQEFTIKYEAKLEGDTLKGKTEFNAGGQSRSRDWEAKRAASAGGTLNGPWKVVLESPMGQIERSLKFKQDGEKLAGTFTSQLGEMEIKEGKVKGAEFSFLVAVERDGNKMTFNYKGKQDGDKIKGTVDYDLAGNTGTIDFHGERAKDEPKKQEKKPEGEKK
jgi:hypothetical protein